MVYDELKTLEAKKKSIKVGLVGAGFMGKGIVEVIESTPGMEVVAVSDIEIERASACFEGIHFNKYKEIKKAQDARNIQFPDERVVTLDYQLVPEIEGLDFIIEATGIPEIGAQIAYHSIRNGKHIGMLKRQPTELEKP